MCKVSVVVPVYNVEKYLEECLDSILKQDFQDMEVICVEDVSTDNSLRELYTYAEDMAVECVVFNMQSLFEGSVAKERFVNKDTIFAGQIPERVMNGKELFCQYAQMGVWRIEAYRYFWCTDFLKENQLSFYEGVDSRR